MNRGVLSVTVALALVTPSAASAIPITDGVWSEVAGLTGDGSPFWDGLSWDCPTCGIGYLIGANSGLEYLHDGSGGYVAFTFDDPIITPTVLFSFTAWTDGVLWRSGDGSFSYDSGTGRLSDSLEVPGQFALFRRVGSESTEYFLGIEDILLWEPNDRDYNDYVISFILSTRSLPSESLNDRDYNNDIVAVPVPEPSSLLLLGTAIAGLAARKVRRFRPPRRR